MSFITTRDGTNLYVKDWGAGRPVVLIHGWPLNADSWDAQALALAEAGFRAIAYDRRGFGRSDQPWSGYDYDTLADDLADVLQGTGATSDVTLVGFSMGGGEVARYMSRHNGQGVVAAGLIGSVVPGLLQSDTNPEGAPREALEGIGQGIRADRHGFFREFFPSFYGNGWISKDVSQGQIDTAFQWSNMAGLRGVLACAESFSFTDFVPDLAAFRVPTLIVHGTDDRTVPIGATARRAAAAIPGVQLIEYDGAAHGLTASHQDRFTKDLLTFLGR
jgi:pimeloyl-ACP methyl ester carboxylesterase